MRGIGTVPGGWLPRGRTRPPLPFLRSVTGRLNRPRGQDSPLPSFSGHRLWSASLRLSLSPLLLSCLIWEGILDIVSLHPYVFQCLSLKGNFPLLKRLFFLTRHPWATVLTETLLSGAFAWSVPARRARQTCRRTLCQCRFGAGHPQRRTQPFSPCGLSSSTENTDQVPKKPLPYSAAYPAGWVLQWSRRDLRSLFRPLPVRTSLGAPAACITAS